jgi:Holliday junction resolvasome RuvABC endonuclease subunit
MANILALDASTHRTGYAFFKDNQIQYGAISSSSTSPEKRIGVMRDEILKIIKQENIDTIIMEEVRPDGMNQHTGKLLTWLQGCIVVAVFEYNKNIKVDFIGASTWRSRLGLQGYRVLRQKQKEIDIDFANTTYCLKLSAEMDDEADAICILTAYKRDAAALANKKPSGSIGEEESAF